MNRLAVRSLLATSIICIFYGSNSVAAPTGIIQEIVALGEVLAKGTASSVGERMRLSTASKNFFAKVISDRSLSIDKTIVSGRLVAAANLLENSKFDPSAVAAGIKDTLIRSNFQRDDREAIFAALDAAKTWDNLTSIHKSLFSLSKETPEAWNLVGMVLALADHPSLTAAVTSIYRESTELSVDLIQQSTAALLVILKESPYYTNIYGASLAVVFATKLSKKAYSLEVYQEASRLIRMLGEGSKTLNGPDLMAIADDIVNLGYKVTGSSITRTGLADTPLFSIVIDSTDRFAKPNFRLSIHPQFKTQVLEILSTENISTAALLETIASVNLITKMSDLAQQNVGKHFISEIMSSLAGKIATSKIDNSLLSDVLVTLAKSAESNAYYDDVANAIATIVKNKGAFELLDDPRLTELFQQKPDFLAVIESRF
ncbi:MAG: hypothetical protein AB7H97_01085 [Pseudobdellovibrionaceae bacterium]